MKIRTRIATAIAAVLASLFVAAPALASEGGHDDSASMFSHVNDPIQVPAILILGAILLVIVLVVSTLTGNLFDKDS